MSIWRIPTCDIIAIAIAITCSILWIENRHRIALEPRTETESALATGVEACPTNDNATYSGRCLPFRDDGTPPQRRITTLPNKPASTSTLRPNISTRADGSPCPDSDKGPYTASCLAFLTGATELGMTWRIHAPDLPARTDVVQ